VRAQKPSNNLLDILSQYFVTECALIYSIRQTNVLMYTPRLEAKRLSFSRMFDSLALFILKGPLRLEESRKKLTRTDPNGQLYSHS